MAEMVHSRLNGRWGIFWLIYIRFKSQLSTVRKKYDHYNWQCKHRKKKSYVHHVACSSERHIETVWFWAIWFGLAAFTGLCLSCSHWCLMYHSSYVSISCFNVIWRSDETVSWKSCKCFRYFSAISPFIWQNLFITLVILNQIRP